MRVTTSVAIIDEQPLFAEGVQQVLRTSGVLSVVGVGHTSAEALAIVAERRPEMLIMDISVGGCGHEAARSVLQMAPETKIVFLTSSEHEEDVSRALGEGARGYLLKGIGKREFVATLGEIANGSVYVDPRLGARMLAHIRRNAAISSTLPELTPREKGIISLVAQGKTNKEVAGILKLGDKTVKHHMTRIMQKLQVRNRVEAVLFFKTRLAARAHETAFQTSKVIWSGTSSATRKADAGAPAGPRDVLGQRER